jgi:hypothetical protein
MNGTGAFTTSRAKGSSMERLKVPEFGLIGRVLRAQFEDAIAQPLPERWIDVIRQLRERERQKSDVSPAEPPRQSEQE